MDTDLEKVKIGSASEFAEFLAIQRKLNGRLQGELGSVSQSWVSKLESGRKNLKELQAFIMAAQSFGYDLVLQKTDGKQLPDKFFAARRQILKNKSTNQKSLKEPSPEKLAAIKRRLARMQRRLGNLNVVVDSKDLH